MAVKRKSLDTNRTGASASEPLPKTGFKTSAVNFPLDVWELLRDAAFRRAKQTGGRPSVSSLIAELVRENRQKLEA